MDWRGVLGALAAAAFAGGALGQDADDLAITDEDIAFYIAESWAQYELNPVHRLYRQLYEASTAHPDAEGAVAAFAERLRVDVPTAATYASILIEAERHRPSCEYWGECPLDPELLAALRSVGPAEPTGELLLAAMGVLGPHIVDVVLEHPRGEALLIPSDSSFGFQYIAFLLLTPDASPAVSRAALNFTSDGVYRGTDILAALDAAVERFSGPADRGMTHAAVSAAFMHELLEHGLDAQALATLDGLTDEEQALLLDGSSPIFMGDDGLLPARARFFRLNANLAAAMLAAGRRADAAERIGVLRGRRGKPSRRERLTLELLEEAASPSLSSSQAFDMVLLGAPDQPERLVPLRTPGYGVYGVDGWMSIAARGSPALRSITADYLRGRSREEMAEAVLSPDLFPGSTSLHDLQGLPSWVSERVDGRRHAAATERYAHEIDLAQQRYVALRRTAAPAAPLTPSEDRPVPYVVRDMPADLRDAEPIAQSLRDLDRGAIGVEPYYFARVERDGDEWIVICLGHTLDPGATLSGGGYWAVRSRDAGEHWEEPVYLGVRPSYAKVIHSALPMLEGDHLRLEVEITETDPDNPRMRRSRSDVYLDFSWADLTRDGDGDGLTDIVEHRLGLSATSNDTDGDGAPDGADSLPAVPFAPSEESFELGLAFVESIFGDPRHALVVGPLSQPGERPSTEEMVEAAMDTPHTKIDLTSTRFLVGDPSLFSGLRLPFRLIVLSQEEAERMSSEYGARYPAIRWAFTDAETDRRFVIWDGGSFIVRKTTGGYEAEVLR